MSLEPGLSGSASLTVDEGDLATEQGSGSVPVLATPRLVALCEQATVASLRGHLGAGQTTVGMRIQIDHLAPTPVGRTVTADASLEKVQGRRLTFTVSASDDRGLIGAGKVTRVLVDADRFMEKAGS